MPESVAPRFLTREQAAEATGLSVDTISRLIHSGQLAAKRTSRDADGNPAGRYRISHKALEDWFSGLPDAY